jgi:low temperature requirement protein LtrA
MTGGMTSSLLRDHSGAERVTNIELFFDLVYVFAITQLSHHLLATPPGRERGRSCCS